MKRVQRVVVMRDADGDDRDLVYRIDKPESVEEAIDHLGIGVALYILNIHIEKREREIQKQILRGIIRGEVKR